MGVDVKDWRNVVIVGLLAMLVWFGSAVIRLEQYRYASMLQFCGNAPDELERARQQACLSERKDLRTSPMWDLAYGLGLL